MKTKTPACKQCQSQRAFISGIDHGIRALMRRLEKGWGSIADLAELKEDRARAVEDQKAHQSQAHAVAA